MAGSFYARHAFVRSMSAMKIISRGTFHFAPARETPKRNQWKKERRWTSWFIVNRHQRSMNRAMWILGHLWRATLFLQKKKEKKKKKLNVKYSTHFIHISTVKHRTSWHTDQIFYESLCNFDTVRNFAAVTKKRISIEQIPSGRTKGSALISGKSWLSRNRHRMIPSH